MTKQATLQGLFGTPLYSSNIGRSYTKEETNFFENSKKHVRQNSSKVPNPTTNSYTGKNKKGTYILDLEKLSTLRKDVMVHVQSYFEKIYAPNTDCSIYLTQSWINYTEEGQQHHAHFHSNSLVSGVVYLDADKQHDGIIFFRPQNFYDRTIHIDPKQSELNEFNAPKWDLPVETGDIVLFPSYLKHSVDTKNGKNTRTSLAFNTFVKGTIGGTFNLTELRL